MLTFWPDMECFVDCYENRWKDVDTPGASSDLLATANSHSNTHKMRRAQGVVGGAGWVAKEVKFPRLNRGGR